MNTQSSLFEPKKKKRKLNYVFIEFSLVTELTRYDSF